jgi:hypothetical protein
MFNLNPRAVYVIWTLINRPTVLKHYIYPPRTSSKFTVYTNDIQNSPTNVILNLKDIGCMSWHMLGLSQTEESKVMCLIS